MEEEQAETEFCGTDGQTRAREGPAGPPALDSKPLFLVRTQTCGAGLVSSASTSLSSHQLLAEAQRVPLVDTPTEASPLMYWDPALLRPLLRALVSYLPCLGPGAGLGIGGEASGCRIHYGPHSPPH